MCYIELLGYIQQTVPYISNLPPLTTIKVGPDCEATSDTLCAKRQQKSAVEIIRYPGETFDVKCIGRGENIDHLTLEKYE